MIKWIFWIAVDQRSSSARSPTARRWSRCSSCRPRCSPRCRSSSSWSSRRLHRRHPVRGAVLVPVPRRRRDVLPGRHRAPVLRRLGPGPRAGAGEGEHRPAGEARGDRGPRRPRPLRHPALGAARHRQDADGRGGGRRDRQALRVRRPRRLQRTCSSASASSRSRACSGSCASSRCGTTASSCSSTRPTCSAAGRRGADAGARPGRGHPRRPGTPPAATATRTSRRTAAACSRSRPRSQPYATGEGPDAGRRSRFMMGGAMGGGGDMGTLQALLTELSGPQEAARLRQPVRPPRARHATEAAAEVPDPRDDGEQPARGARPRAAAARAASTASTGSATRARPAASAPTRATSSRCSTT